jgi:CubicO group peptidase (beta-lactamase class C family)
MKRRALALAFLLCLSPFASIGAQAQSPAASPSRAEVARYARDLLTRNYRANAPGAAMLVARGDRVLFRAARGEADIQNHVPLRPDSVFRIGSVTKQFTAAGLLMLVEAGRVRLDDPLSRYLPDYPGGDRITLLQLLNHTAGVRDYTAIPNYVESAIRRDMNTAQMIDVFRNERPDFAPGSRWAYSNSGYVLVGAVIEAVTGEPWYAYLERALFRPLGMNHTGYGNDPRFAALQVRGYSYDRDRVVPARLLSMTQPHAAGALVSNVDDLLRWNRALHEGRVLGNAAYTRMITPVGRAAEAASRYGFGLYNDRVRNRAVLRHGGAIFGFISALSYIPGPDISVVILENDDASDDAEPAGTIARRLAAMALGDPYPLLRPVAADAATLRAAEGVYRFENGVVRVLRLVEGNLTVQRGSAARVVLTPIAADDFLYPDGFNRLKLERDAGGGIGAIRLFANGDGDGEVGARTNDPPPAAPVAMQLPRAALERLVGTYARGGLSLRVYLQAGALTARMANQDPLGLRATSTTRFEIDESGAVVEFPAGDAPAAEVTIRQNGREIILRRLP